MAVGRIKNTELSAIAAAIRQKNGLSTTYKPGEMAQAILDIPTGSSAVIESKSITQNGTYTAPTDVDGYSPVVVAVQPSLQSKTATQNGTVTPDSGYDGLSSVVVNVSGGGGVIFTADPDRVASMVDGEVVFLETFYSYSVSATKPTCQAPSAGIAGQNSGYAMACLSSTQTSSYTWTTSDNNYNALWIGADFGEPVVLNAVTVAPRTWSGNRQISDVIFEASVNGSEWILIGTGSVYGNGLADATWNNFVFGSNVAFRYYRLRTTSGMHEKTGVNGSATFTLYGLGFYYSSDISSNGYTDVFWRDNGVTRSYKIV